MAADDTRLAGTLPRVHVAGTAVGAMGETVTRKAGILGWGLVVILLKKKSQVGLVKVPELEGGGAPHNCS